MSDISVLSSLKSSSLAKLLLRFDILAFLSCIAIFYFWPQIDISVSHFFYDDKAKDFPLKHHYLADFIYDFTNIVGGVFLISLSLLTLLSLFNKHSFTRLSKKAIVFLLLVLITGPGILVNNIIKDTWSRPRPRQVIEFGGEQQFQTPFKPDPSREHGKSFVSGHAAIGFYFVVIALLIGKRKWLILPLVTGSIVGLTRILQGGHFLSDVIFAGWVTWFVALFFYYLIFKEAPFRQKSVQHTQDKAATT